MIYKCSKCGITKEFSEFYKTTQTKSGIRCHCKSCMNIDRKKYVIKHKLEVSEYQKQWSQKNRKYKSMRNAINFNKKDNGLYVKYYGMYGRCNYKSSPSYKNYGERGICVEWKSYSDFKNDMYESFIEHLNKYGKSQTTLDRVNNDGNYSKENCRWATRSQQQFNRRKKH